MNSTRSVATLFDRRVTHPSVVTLVHSVALLAFVVGIALIGLAAAQNWPKLLRVGLACGAYAAALVAGIRFRSNQQRIQYVLFAAAGAGAGLVSGLARPTIDVPVAIVLVLAGAFLLGTVHWAGVGRYEEILSHDDRPSDRAR